MKRNFFGIGLIATLALTLFTGCPEVPGTDEPENKPAMAKIIFDESKISCKDTSNSFDEKEIKSGDCLELGLWYLDFEAKDYRDDCKVIWSFNDQEEAPDSYRTYSIRGHKATDYCVQVDGKYQMTVDVTVRDAVNPVVEFDSEKFTCRSYTGSTYLEIMSSVVTSGSVVKEGRNLIFISKDSDKVITSYTINGGNAQTAGINFSQLENVPVCPENSVDNTLKIEIATRDIVKGVLTISDDDVVCLKRIGIRGTSPLTNGAEVRENDVISFFHKQRGFITDAYTLNGTDSTEKLYKGYVNEITVSENTVKDGKLEFSFKTHDALSATVKINEDLPFFKIHRYASNDAVRSTDEGIDRNSLTLYEGEKIEFHEDDTFASPIYGFTAASHEFYRYSGANVINRNDYLILSMGTDEVLLENDCEFKKLSE